MRLIYFSLGLFLLSSFAHPVFSQTSPVPIGVWKNYIPFSLFNSITQSEDKIFATSDLAVMAVDKQDYSKSFITKLNGLTSSGTRFLKYIPAADGLVVTYNDSQFDLVLQNNTINYDNIKTDGSFFNREILDVALLKEEVIYFCTAFGLIEFFPTEEEFGFTLNLGAAVNGITYLNDHYYAATDSGLLRAPDDPTINLKDIANWESIGPDASIHPDISVTKVEAFQNEIYFAKDSAFMKLTETGFDTIFLKSEFEVAYATAEGEHLVVGYSCIDDCGGETFIIDADGNITPYEPKCINRPLYAIEDQYGQFWASDRWGSLRRSTIEQPGICDKYIREDRPIREAVNEIALRGDEIWLVSNNIRPTDFNPQFKFFGVLAGIDGIWQEFKPGITPGLAGHDGLAYHRILAAPNGDIFVGTNSQGLLKANANNEFTYFDDQNSALTFGADANRIRVAGLAMDDQGNLWMSNNTSDKPLVVMTPDGNTSNDFSSQIPPGSAIRDLAIDFSGYKWFTVDKNGLLVYDDNGTLNTNADDRVRIIKTTNSVLPVNETRCVEVDLDGEVWVGTDLGVASFNCGSGVFEAGECKGFLQVVEVDGFRANLLETESVRAIAVDGANRKWFGTTSGVFLMSPNGKEQLAFFNTSNSPLPDNFINDIKIHPETGEVFIATGKGLVSYRGEATTGAPFHNEATAYAYPNPVRPDYRGPIAIKGLTRDADIKITDVNGQLVYEARALGGQAVWDGNDYTGRRANSGVYYVFSTSDDELNEPNTLITKVLFIN